MLHVTYEPYDTLFVAGFSTENIILHPISMTPYLYYMPPYFYHVTPK